MRIQLGTENHEECERDPGVLAVDQFLTEEQAERLLQELEEEEEENRPEGRHRFMSMTHDLRTTNSLLHLLRVPEFRSYLPNCSFRAHLGSGKPISGNSEANRRPRRSGARPRSQSGD